MLTALDHVAIAVRDLDAATATYTRLIGRGPSWRGTHPGAGTANTLFRFPRTYVELLSPVGSGALATALNDHLERHDEGLFGLAFSTADAAACAMELRARGLSAGDPADGGGCNAHTGAERLWRTVGLPLAQTRGVTLFAIEHRSPPDTLPLAAASDSGPIDGVDHVVVMTAAADAAAALYGQQLGLRLAFDRTFAERGLRLLFFRIGGVTVELAAPLAAPDPAALDRLWGISWRVADVGHARVRLLAAGFELSDVRPGHKAGTRVCTVRGGGTCGVATLLIESVPPAGAP